MYSQEGFHPPLCMERHIFFSLHMTKIALLKVSIKNCWQFSVLSFLCLFTKLQRRFWQLRTELWNNCTIGKAQSFPVQLHKSLGGWEGAHKCFHVHWKTDLEFFKSDNKVVRKRCCSIPCHAEDMKITLVYGKDSNHTFMPVTRPLKDWGLILKSTQDILCEWAAKKYLLTALRVSISPYVGELSC